MAVLGIGRLIDSEIQESNSGRVGSPGGSDTSVLGKTSGRSHGSGVSAHPSPFTGTSTASVTVGTAGTREFDTTKDIDNGTGVPKGIPLIRNACSNSTSRFLYPYRTGADRAGEKVDVARARTTRFMEERMFEMMKMICGRECNEWERNVWATGSGEVKMMYKKDKALCSPTSALEKKEC